VRAGKKGDDAVTKEIKLKLTLDNGQFVATVSSSESALRGMQRTASSITFGEMARGAVVLTGIATAARAAASAIQAIPAKGISFIADTEVAQLGMAGILQSMIEIEGKAPSFAQAQDIAAGAVTRLQKAAAETAASSNDLIATYRALLGPALAAGMSMQQVEKFTVVGANAIKSMGMSTGQMVQELRDLAQGGITAAGSTLATALGLKDADINKAKASSEGLFTFLMGRMQGFASTSGAYTQTLQGGWEALGEQMTQASAAAMAPAAEAAKGAIAEISEALKGDQIKESLNGMGQGVATLITSLSAGVGIVQQYGGAIGAMAAAVALAKFSSLAGEIATATNAKMLAASASRLAAAQAIVEAGANDTVTLSSRAQLAALLAEQRAKVQALFQEQALTAAKLRSAEATAAQLVGQARLNALEQQVLPLRQQHAQQTTALEQGQQRLAGATNAASAATRAMGLVVGALGGPIGIAITAAALLAGAFMSARSEAEKLGKTKLSVERVESALSSGGKVDQTDASRLQSELSEAKEKRDGLLAESRKRSSMYDRSKGLFGGDSNVEKRAAELAQAEAEVKKFEALTGRVEAAQQRGSASASGIGLRGGVSSTALDEMLSHVKTAEGVKKEGAERIQALETMANAERALMLKRSATAAELAQFDAKVSGAKTGMQRDLTLELQGIASKTAKAAKGLGATETDTHASQIERAGAGLRTAQLKAAAQERVQVLETEQRTADHLHQMGLTGVTEYETERVRIQRAKLAERMTLIDAEIAAEESRKPKSAADKIQVQRRIVDLKADRSAITAEMAGAASGGAAAAEARKLDDQRAIATETAQIWQAANAQITQLRNQNSQAAIGAITDPVAKLRAESAARVAELYSSADELTKGLELKISLTADPGQREMLRTQVSSIAEETGRAIALENTGLTERLKPGWQTMVEGWADANKLMRESSDRTMDMLVKGGEDAFAEFVTTGKISVKSLANSMISEMARTEYRKFLGGGPAGGAGGGGGLGSLVKMVTGLFAADGAAFEAGGTRRFAGGGSFTNRVIDRDTHFRYAEGGREKLGLMGEAGPEAIMPLSGGGAQAIGADGRKLGHLPVIRGPGGRLSVVLDEQRQATRRFADGGAFGNLGGSATVAQASARMTAQVSAPLTVQIMDLGQVAQMIQAAQAQQYRALQQRLKTAAGISI
jgi:hypothetical protein